MYEHKKKKTKQKIVFHGVGDQGTGADEKSLVPLTFNYFFKIIK